MKPWERRVAAGIVFALALTVLLSQLSGAWLFAPAEPEAATTTITTTTTRPPSTTTTVAPFRSALTFGGNGSDVIDVAVPGDATAIVEIMHGGEDVFRVRALDENGERLVTLANRTGIYQGMRAINAAWWAAPLASLEIESTGAWELSLAPLSQAPQFTDGVVDGVGDFVVVDVTPATTAIEVGFAHQGSGIFRLRAMAESTRRILVDETGDVSGTVRSIPAAALYEVTASGPWSLDFGAG